jgi:hypothetical protein
MEASDMTGLTAAAAAIVDSAELILTAEDTSLARGQLEVGYPDDAIDVVLLGLIEQRVDITGGLHDAIAAYIDAAWPSDPEFNARLAKQLTRIPVTTAA